MAFAIGHISGCHLNPAVSLGLLTGGRFKATELLPYVVSQVVGGLAGADVLYLIASGKARFSLSDGFASNGYGDHSPGGYALGSCFIAEVVLTFMFLMIIFGRNRLAGSAGICTHRHRIGTDVDSSNWYPCHESFCKPGPKHGSRSVRGWMGRCSIVAVLGGTLIGAAVAGIVYRSVFEKEV